MRGRAYSGRLLDASRAFFHGATRVLGHRAEHGATESIGAVRATFATTAIERATLGGQWLARIQRQDGSFFYIYDPVLDEYDTTRYNEVRHAGTLSALFLLYGAKRDPIILEAGERAARFVGANSLPVTGAPGLAYLMKGRGKLGGQALAIVSLLERRKTVGDERHDTLIQALGEFLLGLRLDSPTGAFHNSYDNKGGKTPGPASRFYPGEALLAMSMLASQFPEGPYLQCAEAAANYLIHEKDGDFVAEGRLRQEDHWLVMGLNQLSALLPRADFRLAAYLNAERMAKQLSSLGGERDTPSRSGPSSFSGIATRGEALVAASELARRAGDLAQANRYLEAACNGARFLMRVQYTGQNAGVFANPERVIGGWASRPGRYDIRIDQVQHSMAVLLGVWRLLEGQSE